MRFLLRRSILAAAIVGALVGCSSNGAVVDTSSAAVSTGASASSVAGTTAGPVTNGSPAGSPTVSSGGPTAAGPAPSSPDSEHAAPKIDAHTIDGGTITGDQIWGSKPAVLVFFTSWCQTCAQNQAEVTKLADKYQGRVNFVGVSADDKAADLGKYLAEHPVSYPVISDPQRQVWKSYAISEPPFLIVVKAGGELFRGWPGLPLPTLQATLDGLVGP